ncbi:OmpA family protein [Roseitalea porphyridii]|uniref:OmpA family protein n=1 Tax=Roseitalea porphyridii TaxID=1852022 RepID=A0A4P6V1V3_9HYPH|nr:OmpA family protein [Roseitalea porphyridii]QBK30556.1 OmpA family protein [Roseitalea porphyridii]
MKAKTLTALASVLVFTAACTTTDPFTGQQRVSNTAGGAALGAAAGAGLGLLAGGDDRRNALIGAGIGAIAGGAVGNYMDRQQAELRAQLQGTGVSVTRVGNNIILNMPSNITFATDQDQVVPAFFPTLDSVALVLQRYNQTLINVYGHTDSTGDDSYNQALSQRRAQSVANYLGGRGVNPQRFLVSGFGESRPIADNSTEAGRAQNRRVEIELVPLS